jgi:hypothetical protein
MVEARCSVAKRLRNSHNYRESLIHLDHVLCVHIYCVREVFMKNITLSIDEDVLQAGREYARSHNISFNVLVRELIEQTVVSKGDKWLEDTLSLMDKIDVSSEGITWTREELYRV